jgi:hypothetical protein
MPGRQTVRFGARDAANARGQQDRVSGLGGPVSLPMSDRARNEIWAGGQFIEGFLYEPRRNPHL